jgi:hypothetical protein
MRILAVRIRTGVRIRFKRPAIGNRVRKSFRVNKLKELNLRAP